MRIIYIVQYRYFGSSHFYCHLKKLTEQATPKSDNCRMLIIYIYFLNCFCLLLRFR